MKNSLLRTVAAFLLTLMIISSLPFGAIVTSAYSAGDLNNDGKINAIDSNLILKVLTGNDTPGVAKAMADINYDSKVNSIDSSLLKKVLLNLYTIDAEPYKIGEILLGGTDICEYSIRIPTEYPKGAFKESMQYAAELIQKYIKEACGITLPIVTEKTEHDIAFVFDIEDYGDEAFNISVDDGKVTLYCGAVRGPLYSAFGFLEEIIGYRFYGSDLKYLDAKSKVNVAEGYSHTEGVNTTFRYRHTYTRLYKDNKYLGGYDKPYPDSITAAHITGFWDGMQDTMWNNKYTYGYAPDRVHTACVLMPEASGHKETGLVCFSNEATYTECIATMDGYLKKLLSKGFSKDNLPMISISINDDYHWCTCRLCSKSGRDYGSNSAVVINFIKRVSDHFTPEYPDLKFWTLAYFQTSHAPTKFESGGVKLEIPDNLYFCYCYYPSCGKHSVDGSECDYTNNGTHNKWNDDNLKSWLSVTDNVHVWYYSVPFYYSVTGDPIITRAYRDFEYFYSLGIKGIFAQASYDTLGWDALYTYMLSELMWNPDMTYEEYLDKGLQFCLDYYGEGGAEVFDYIMSMDEIALESGDCWCILGDSPNYLYDYDFIYGIFDESVNSINNALAMAKTPEETERIEILEIQMYFMGLTASYDKMYVGGDSASRKLYEERYSTMWNLVKKYESKIIFGVDTGTTMATVPATDAPMNPINWYSKPDVRVHGTWW